MSTLLQFKNELCRQVNLFSINSLFISHMSNGEIPVLNSKNKTIVSVTDVNISDWENLNRYRLDNHHHTNDLGPLLC